MDLASDPVLRAVAGEVVAWFENVLRWIQSSLESCTGMLLEYQLEAGLMRDEQALTFARRSFQRLLADARG